MPGNRREGDTLFDKAWSVPFLGFLGVKRVKRILEIGCGTGMWTSTLSNLFPKSKLIAVDVSRDAAIRTKSRIRNRNLEVIICDVHHLPFVSGCFDLAACRRLLMNIGHRKKALLEMKRVTKNNGVVCAIEPSFRDAIEYSTLPSELNFYRKLLNLTSGSGNPRPDMSFGKKTPALFAACGLEPMKVMVFCLTSLTTSRQNCNSVDSSSVTSLKRIRHFTDLSRKQFDELSLLARTIDTKRREQVVDKKYVYVSIVPFVAVRATKKDGT